MEDQAHGPRGRHAPGQGQVHDRGVHLGSPELLRLSHGGRRVVQDPVGPLHADAVAQVGRAAHGERPALRPAHDGSRRPARRCARAPGRGPPRASPRSSWSPCRAEATACAAAKSWFVPTRRCWARSRTAKIPRPKTTAPPLRMSAAKTWAESAGTDGSMIHQRKISKAQMPAIGRRTPTHFARVEQADVPFRIHPRNHTRRGCIERQGRSAPCECAHRSICARDFAKWCRSAPESWPRLPRVSARSEGPGGCPTPTSRRHRPRRRRGPSGRARTRAWLPRRPCRRSRRSRRARDTPAADSSSRSSPPSRKRPVPGAVVAATGRFTAPGI